jgi:hypothetical protein
MSSRVAGRMADINAKDYTDLNPDLRNVRVLLPMKGDVKLVGAYPACSGATVKREGDFLSVKLEYLKDHAAVALGYATPPTFSLCGDTVPETTGDFHPVDPLTSGFVEDFEGYALGSHPGLPWQAWDRDAATVRVTDQDVPAGRRCVKFTDAEKSSFYPFMNRAVTRFRQGNARLGFDLKVDGAECLLEVRYEGKGPGPAVRFSPEGKVFASGRELGDFPLSQWIHAQVDFSLGGEKPSYTLTLTAPGQEPQVYKDLPYATEWFFLCDSVYFVGSGEKAGSFSLDNVRFERF